MRCIDAEGKQIGVIPTEEALRIANEAKRDLVEVAPDAKPPVCRIMDYGKFRYEQTKKEKLSKKRQHAIKIKEIKLRPGIFDHDYNIKLEHIKEFLGKANKVKLTIMFRGRQMANRDTLGRELFDRVSEDIKGLGLVEGQPKSMGRSVTLIIGPTKSSVSEGADSKGTKSRIDDHKKGDEDNA